MRRSNWVSWIQNENIAPPQNASSIIVLFLRQDASVDVGRTVGQAAATSCAEKGQILNDALIKTLQTNNISQQSKGKSTETDIHK